MNLYTRKKHHAMTSATPASAANALAAFAFAAVFMTALASPPAFAETRVSGIIDRETRWKAEDGPFIVEGDILVTRFANLVIAPGTHIIIKKDAAKTILAEPVDKADSTLVSIRVQGSIMCVGRRNSPITFEPEVSGLANFAWRGLILDKADAQNTEIAFTNVYGASTGLTIRNTSVMVRNSAFENNNIGLHIAHGGVSRIYNNQISNSFTAAIKVERANPQIVNNILAFNKNIGLWCDNRSKITFKYNNVFGNPDGDFLDCDPELGRLSRIGRNRDSTDAHHNIMRDPIFVGSPAEARAIELDVTLQTDSAKVQNKRLLNIPNFQFGKPKWSLPTTVGTDERQISSYSPCINAGDPGGAFKNSDGTRNTIGPMGGPDFWSR